jgi:hypothetical protein
VTVALEGGGGGGGGGGDVKFYGFQACAVFSDVP